MPKKKIQVNVFLKEEYFNENAQAIIPGSWEAWVINPGILEVDQIYDYGDTHAEAVQNIANQIQVRFLPKEIFEIIVTES